MCKFAKNLAHFTCSSSSTKARVKPTAFTSTNLFIQVGKLEPNILLAKRDTENAKENSIYFRNVTLLI